MSRILFVPFSDSRLKSLVLPLVGTGKLPRNGRKKRFAHHLALDVVWV